MKFNKISLTSFLIEALIASRACKYLNILKNIYIY